MGASDDVQYVVEPHRLSGVVEGWQWKVTYSTSGVTIEDVRSTNGAVLDSQSEPGRCAAYAARAQKRW